MIYAELILIALWLYIKNYTLQNQLETAENRYEDLREVQLQVMERNYELEQEVIDLELRNQATTETVVYLEGRLEDGKVMHELFPL